jgi:hypothetical protein
VEVAEASNGDENIEIEDDISSEGEEGNNEQEEDKS